MRFRFRRALLACATMSIAVFVAFAVVHAAIDIPTGAPYSQTFDSIGTTATATLPVDFRADRTTTATASDVRKVGTFAAAGTTTALLGGANLGISASNGIYNFGSGTTTTGPDRAIGFLASGTATASGNLYAQLTNNTGGPLTGLQISYDVEKYRNGTNPAGFRIQLFYSTDGATWTNAGSGFLTAFAGGDAANAGFATAPGATVSITNQTLPVAIPASSTFYLAWNYSVSTGSTVSSAQALAVDNISIAGVTSGGDTAPSVSSTTPANGATNVAVNATVVINFSESVTASASAFSLECPALSPQAFTQTASPATTFTLTPNASLPAGTTCQVTVSANEVADVDGTADPMTANYVFMFTTVSLTDTAPFVSSTTPASGATSVPANSTIVVTFSESVTASPTAFSLECPTGVLQVFGQSVAPATSYTLTPSSPLPYSTTCTATVTAGQVSDTDGIPPAAMASDVAFSFTTAASPPPGAGTVLINELDADTPGSDSAEFVELYDGGAGNTPLDGLVVVFFEGGSTGSGNLSYATFDLDGYSTDANGYFIMGNPGVPGASLIFEPGEFGLLSNGPDAVGLYIGNGGNFPPGTIATTTNLQDAIVYGTDDPNASGLLPLLNAGQKIVNENATGNSQTQSSQRCPNGMGGFRNTSPYYPGPPTPGTANTCPATRPPSDVVISQVYGGGGNGGATYRNDYVELYNRGAGPVDLTGWSLQYASSTGSGWDFNKQPLGGAIGAGEYYLIALASGGANGADLPPANITGLINMAAGSGKIALVGSFTALVGNCPIFDPGIKDLVGYGSADCGEGSTTAPAGTNAGALFRKNNGSLDTDSNANDFDPPATPGPRQTAPIVELGPNVLATDPRFNSINAPRDATIQVTFTEPVDVDTAWFTLTCAGSGPHSSATFAVSFGGRDHYVTPNDSFIAGELCTVTILKDRIHDQDPDDSGPNTDTLPADYSWSFAVASGTEPPYPANVHLTLGNPSAAGSDPSNYLMEKPEFAVSYNRDLGRPNWVSWHLSNEWIGTLTRVDTFRPDPQIPPDWYRVQSFDFSGSGFDRGHMTPNADRDKETSIPINQATFLMSNMVAQAPGNNQGPWAAFEGFLRTLVEQQAELYIVSGPTGVGGTGSLGGLTTTLAAGHVTVPSSTWKVALVLPADGGDDLPRVDCSTRTIAVIMPNQDSIRNNPWESYLTTVDAVETLTGHDFFSNLPPDIQACVEAGTNGNNPPLDTIAPSVSCSAPDGLWHADNVALACTASDSGSGLANPADASFSLVTAVVAGTETANAGTDSRVVCDVAGHCTTAGPIAGNKIDRKAPVILLTTPAGGAVYQLGQVVNAAYSCADAGSGQCTATGTAANLSPIDTSTRGLKTFVVNATDAVGNPSSVTVSYEVRRTLSAVGPATVWVGLKDSDGVGLRLDLRAELLVDGALAASGTLSNVSTGSSGFNNALLNSVAMSMTSGPVEIPPGAEIAVRVSTRRTCVGGGHQSGKARAWYNGAAVDAGPGRDAGSRLQLTLAGITSSYFLRNTFALSTVAGSARQSLDVQVKSTASCPARPFVPFGTWSVVVP